MGRNVYSLSVRLDGAQCLTMHLTTKCISLICLEKLSTCFPPQTNKTGHSDWPNETTCDSQKSSRMLCSWSIRLTIKCLGQPLITFSMYLSVEIPSSARSHKSGSQKRCLRDSPFATRCGIECLRPFDFTFFLLFSSATVLMPC